MSKCILRVAKINSQGSATGKTTHNYRLAEVPNADPQRKHLNQEYLNNGEKNIWTLANERIEQIGIKRVRKDAVRSMEFLITASPDAFDRDSQGRVGDLRDSGWLQDNINFLAEKYGDNLIALTLHQDEKTPHIHAIVVPITDDKRLSAKELFNPKSLRKLQTQYAQAMSKHGLERGIQGSRARHQTMKQIYGQQLKSQETIENELAPIQASHPPLTIDKPGAFDLLHLERWRQQQEAKINAEYNRQLEQARDIAQKAQNMAIANATAAEQVKVLQQRLKTSESLKQANFEKAKVIEEVYVVLKGNFDTMAVLTDEDRIGKNWVKTIADQVRRDTLPQMQKDILESLKEVSQVGQFYDRLKNKGYRLLPESNVRYLEHSSLPVRIDLTKAEFDGKLVDQLLTQSFEQARQQEMAKKAQEEETLRKAAERKLPEKPKQQPKLGKSQGYERDR